MSAVRLRLKRGDSEIEVEGSKSEVDELLRTWWANSPGDTGIPPMEVAPRKTTRPQIKKRRSPAADQTDSTRFNPLELANAIKEHANYEKFEKQVLHKKGMFNKIALVLVQAELALTSGQITAVLQALDIKADIGNVSNCIKANSGKFLPSTVRRAGGSKPEYRLTSQAKTAFGTWLVSVRD